MCNNVCAMPTWDASVCYADMGCQCVLVCDSDTVRHDEFLKRLVEYFEEHGEYASAQEYVD